LAVFWIKSSGIALILNPLGNNVKHMSHNRRRGSDLKGSKLPYASIIWIRF